MNELNQRILQTCNARINQIKTKLEYEENARKIAKLQGELQGINFFLKQYNEYMPVSEKVFTTDMINNYGFPKEATALTSEELDLFDELINEKERDPYWKKVEESVRGEITRQKDFLFHHAEKSRDLDFVHGKRDGLMLYDNVVSDVIDELKDIKENYPLFNKDEEDRTPVGKGPKLLSNTSESEEAEEIEEDDDIQF